MLLLIQAGVMKITHTLILLAPSSVQSKRDLNKLERLYSGELKRGASSSHKRSRKALTPTKPRVKSLHQNSPRTRSMYTEEKSRESHEFTREGTEKKFKGLKLNPGVSKARVASFERNKAHKKLRMSFVTPIVSNKPVWTSVTQDDSFEMLDSLSNKDYCKGLRSLPESLMWEKLLTLTDEVKSLRTANRLDFHVLSEFRGGISAINTTSSSSKLSLDDIESKQSQIVKHVSEQVVAAVKEIHGVSEVSL